MPPTRITDKPVVLFLSAVVAAFVAGFTAWVYMQNTIRSEVENSIEVLQQTGKLPQGPAGPPGPPGPTGVPIGAIVAFWGAKGAIPEGSFELCDGELVTTEGSPIRGQRKPDLRNKFLKGAQGTVADVAAQVESGGTHQLNLVHSHPAGKLFAMITQQRVSGNSWNVPHVSRGSFDPDNRGHRLNGQTASAAIDGQWSGKEDGRPSGVAVGGDVDDAIVSPLDNRPEFISAYWVIRVK